MEKTNPPEGNKRMMMCTVCGQDYPVTVAKNADSINEDLSRIFEEKMRQYREAQGNGENEPTGV